MQHTEIKLNSKEIFKGNVFRVTMDQVELENGMTSFREVVHHNGGACILPLTDDDKVLMVRQYRNALERETLEIPAGGLNGREEPTDQAAMRELQEETGYHTDHVELLTSIYTTVAFCNEKIDIYLALDLKDRGSQHLDEDEFINVEAYSVEELKQMIYDCKIQDAKTICGILTYASKYLSK